MQNKFYDSEKNRLVYILKEATKDYWDNFWQSQLQTDLDKKKVSKLNYVARVTSKYLKKGAKVLEAGCGNGIQVFKLTSCGFNVTGLDFSPKTIQFLKTNYPDYNFVLGDVRQIPDADNSYDGYWSFGVIEHFYDGYDSILKEMSRVIKPNGYLFLSFPHLSLKRKKNIREGKYPIWTPQSETPENFFQFALDDKNVIKEVEEFSFKLVISKKLSGLSGARDESGFFFPLIDRFYNSKLRVIKPFKTILSFILTYYYSNSNLLVFRKTG